MDRIVGFVIVVILIVLILAKLRSGGPAPAGAPAGTPAGGSSALSVSSATAAIAPALGGRTQIPPGQSLQQAYPAAPFKTTLQRVCANHNCQILQLRISQSNIVELSLRADTRQDLSYVLDDLLYKEKILKDLFHEDMRYWEAIEKGRIAYYAYYRMRIF
mgnify:CR=1 FL=1